jgi:two-component system CheB/CheR fusion protein
MPGQFPIVGVGASAGGLAAITALLQELGPAPRLALVVVTHLDPTHESGLAEILSRATTLPVHQATDGMPVEDGHVYVAPPAFVLTIEKQALKLTPRPAAAILYAPIDQFLESLAADSAGSALGVILTGSGSDGSCGVKAIKAAGGVTFAQDATAEYRGMPSSAIATQCVDRVLPPEGIARELLRIGERSAEQRDAPEGEAAFQRIVSALARSSGIDFTNYKHSTLRRRIERRAAVSGEASLDAYAELVEKNADEGRALRDEVLIHVTSFFRDPEMFEALKALVFPKLLDKRAREPGLRVWVPGCSTGEEVYSIAISLLEVLADSGAPDLPVKLFGTDISAGTIDAARAGKYPASIEREVSRGRLDRYFTKSEGAYQVRKDLRDHCVFARHDATRDPPFAGMDLISCRNLMIYLGPALQDRLLPVFHYALNDPGFLVLGEAESVRAFPGFAPLETTKRRIYARTAAAPRRPFGFASYPLADAASGRELDAAPKPSSALDVHREADRLVLAEFAPPGVVITDDLSIVQFRGRTGPFLQPSPGVPSFELLRMVREELRLPLRQAIDAARLKHVAQRSPAIALGGTPRQTVELEVIPFRVLSTSQRFFVVLFRELIAPESAASLPPAPPAGAREELVGQELASTRTYLQSVIEQLEASNEELKAANEEIVSSNEELRSTNEELQMAKEELQATNEELSTVNEEMAVRNVEATRLSDDLTNVLSSVEIPIVILGRDSRLRRFTPAAAKLLQLLPGDLGRPLDGKSPIPEGELTEMVSDVLEHLSPVSRTLVDTLGCWHQLTVRPYLTLENRIDGTVITAFDIDAVKKSEQLIAQSQKYAESIVDTIRECLLVLDGDLRVRSANRSFHQTFGTSAPDLEGRPLAEIGRGGWDIPALQASLRALGESERLEGYRLERDFPGLGQRTFVLNAHRIEKSTSILLAIDDVTERERAEQALRKVETDFREKLRDHQDKLRMAFEATVAEERERRRIAAHLHDHIGQSLALAQIKLTSVRDALSGAARVAIDEAASLLAQSSTDTRTLIFELSPPILYDLGLKEALAWLGEDLEKRNGLRVALAADDLELPLGETTAALVFRAVRELLTNVVKHSQVSRAAVSLKRSDGQLIIVVSDEGIGFQSQELKLGAHGGFGLFSIREQLSRLGGSVTIDAAKGLGARVTLRVPLDLAGAAAKEGAR